MPHALGAQRGGNSKRRAAHDSADLAHLIRMMTARIADCLSDISKRAHVQCARTCYLCVDRKVLSAVDSAYPLHATRRS